MIELFLFVGWKTGKCILEQDSEQIREVSVSVSASISVFIYVSVFVSNQCLCL